MAGRRMKMKAMRAEMTTSFERTAGTLRRIWERYLDVWDGVGG
jgi:hypothetical protein